MTTHAKHVKDYRIVGCEACGTEGRRYVLDYQHPTWDEPGGWDDRDDGPCPYCEGTGGEIIEVEPIELDDLEVALWPA